MIREMVAALKRYWAPTLPKIDALDLTEGMSVSGAEWAARPHETIKRAVDDSMPAEFAVTGTPRHIPWNRRRKELEASARQKRRQLESFREEA